MKLLSFTFLLFLVAIGCKELAGSDDGETTSASVNGCSGGTDPVNPPPTIPNSFSYPEILRPEKFVQSLSANKLQVLSAGEEFYVLINERCVAEKEEALGDVVSREVFQPKANQALRRRHAYTWKLDEVYSLSEFSRKVLDDPCLLEIDYNSYDKINYESNDTHFAIMNHLDTIQAKEAHDIFYSASIGNTETVVIAIIDSGVDIDHEDLVNRLWVNTDETVNGSDDDGNGYVDDINGYNFATDIADPNPEAWPPPDNGKEDHGTHVAGLAAAEANNATGAAGIMGFNAEIMSLNAFGAVAGASTTNVVNSINYAVDNGADVINMSLGSLSTKPAYEAAIQAAVAAGVTVLASAGNDNQEITAVNFYSPSGYAPNINGFLSVGSMDTVTLARSGFSNYSPTFVEFTAPGSDQSRGGLVGPTIGDAYVVKQGTSMSSPVAAGAAALAIGLLRSRGANPTPAEIEGLLINSADTLSSLNGFVKNSKSLNLLGLANLIEATCPL